MADKDLLNNFINWAASTTVNSEPVTSCPVCCVDYGTEAGVQQCIQEHRDLDAAIDALVRKYRR